MARSTPKDRRSRKGGLDFNDSSQFANFDTALYDEKIKRYSTTANDTSLDPYARQISRDLVNSARAEKEEVERAKQLLLSTKGKPKDVESAMKDTNPYYTRNSYEYSHNCQRCVIAYELQRRGYDVEAQPMDGWGAGSHSYLWRNALKMKPEQLGATRRTQVLPKIFEKMEKWGEGSRGIIRVEWDGARSGHVFNVEFRNGKVEMIEAQSGEYVNWEFYNRSAKPSKFTIYRTDNAPITPAIRYMVKKRGS